MTDPRGRSTCPWCGAPLPHPPRFAYRIGQVLGAAVLLAALALWLMLVYGVGALLGNLLF